MINISKIDNLTAYIFQDRLWAYFPRKTYVWYKPKFSYKSLSLSHIYCKPEQIYTSLI